jgi:predicted DNA-binding transcriptional regulator YafY
MIAMDAAIRTGTFPNIATFRATFEVSERTVHADLDFLRTRLNAPLRYSHDRRGYYYTDPSWMLPSMFATEGELVAFFLSVELARRYLGTTFEQPLRKAVDRLAGSLPSELQVDLHELAQHYTFQSGATVGAESTLLAALFECVRERWRIDMHYFTASSGQRNQRIIEPYHLYNVRGDWQIVAFDHLRQQFRQFAVSRIEHWQVLKNERFSRDPAFSPEDYLRTSFLAERGDTAVEIVIWFDTYLAGYMRGRQFHPSQQIDEHPDQSMTLTFQSGALDEIKRWVLGFGRHARVLAPNSLITAVQTELAETAKIYESS